MSIRILDPLELRNNGRKESMYENKRSMNYREAEYLFWMAKVWLRQHQRAGWGVEPKQTHCQTARENERSFTIIYGRRL